MGDLFFGVVALFTASTAVLWSPPPDRLNLFVLALLVAVGAVNVGLHIKGALQGRRP